MEIFMNMEQEIYIKQNTIHETLISLKKMQKNTDVSTQKHLRFLMNNSTMRYMSRGARIRKAMRDFPLTDT